MRGTIILATTIFLSVSSAFADHTDREYGERDPINVACDLLGGGELSALACYRNAEIDVENGMAPKEAALKVCKIIADNEKQRNCISVIEQGSLAAKSSKNRDFTNYKGDHLDMSGGSVYNTEFIGASLKEANFSAANVNIAIFIGANLQGANFEGATIAGADFRNANLMNVNFKNVTWATTSRYSTYFEMDFKGADLRGADFSGFQLPKNFPGLLIEPPTNDGIAELIRGMWEGAIFNSATKLPFTEEFAVKTAGMIKK